MYLQPGNTTFFSSQWAEVCYFLVQTGTTTGSTAETPVYALYRSQYLLVPNPTNPPGTSVAAGTAGYANISSNLNTQGKLSFNAPDDVARNPANRTLNNGTANISMQQNTSFTQNNYPFRASDSTAVPPAPPTPTPTGSTLVLSNVTSFQVQVFTQAAGDFVDLPTAFPGAAFPGASFDTSNPAAAAGNNILAIKVTIRVWDPSSQLSRQITIIQDM
jgi:hypothetical protein